MYNPLPRLICGGLGSRLPHSSGSMGSVNFYRGAHQKAGKCLPTGPGPGSWPVGWSQGSLRSILGELSIGWRPCWGCLRS
ncbi:MAG: hypothetical protein ACTSRC_18695 [Candidatus Helarchaeota archaeon]